MVTTDEVAYKKAWRGLTNLEQSSLMLSLANNKSTWEIGEILGITHYKYLELKDRAEKMLRLLYDYYQLYDTLVRPNAPLDDRFQSYIEACIEKRVTRKEALIYYGDSSMYVIPIRTILVINQMRVLRESTDLHDQDLYKLIMEFDRWNNWRILPRILQQPSAFKRRNNRRDTFYIKYMCNLGDDKVRILVDKYWYSGKKPCYYFCVFSRDLFDHGYKVVPIKIREKTLENLSNLFIYAFQDEDTADIYGYKVASFQYREKTPTKGQSFWPEYREVLEKSVNYKSVNNMDFYCERLDLAYDSKKHKKTKKKPKSTTRSKESDFYL